LCLTPYKFIDKALELTGQKLGMLLNAPHLCVSESIESIQYLKNYTLSRSNILAWETRPDPMNALACAQATVLGSDLQ
jgi:hypothetical protein